MLQTFIKSLEQAVSDFTEPHTACLRTPGPAAEAAGLGSQIALTWVPPSRAQVTVVEVGGQWSLLTLAADRPEVNPSH